MTGETMLAIYIGVVGVLAISAWMRWRRTPASHPDYGARGDMARLLAWMVLGLGITLARAFFELRSIGFWLCSVALLPIVGCTVFSAWRLVRFYRSERNAVASDPSAPSSAKGRPKA